MEIGGIINMKTISINNRRYIGSKARMLDFINHTLQKEKIEFSSFVDLFGGTGIVGDFFNNPIWHGLEVKKSIKLKLRILSLNIILFLI